MVVYHKGNMLAYSRSIASAKVLLHVFASHKRFDGGWRNHSNAQEEYLFNQTALRRKEPPDGSYPIDGAEGRTGFVVELPGGLSYAFVPAPVAEKASAWSLSDRAARFAELAVSGGYEHVVTGAWGCGVFKNKPEEVARALKAAFRHYGGVVHLCFVDDGVMSRFRSVFE